MILITKKVVPQMIKEKIRMNWTQRRKNGFGMCVRIYDAYAI